MDKDDRRVSSSLRNKLMQYSSGSPNVNSGGVVCIGGPAFTMWVTPTDEELFKKYNPELQKRSLERRYEKQKEFDDFVGKLKEYSKSDKPSMYLHTRQF